MKNRGERAPYLRRLLGLIFVVGLSGAVLGGLLMAAAPRFGLATKNAITSDPEPLAQLAELDRPSIVYSRDGSLLTTFKTEVNRKPVALAEVPAVVRHAVLDVEDSGFYGHNGVDVKAVARAILTNAREGALLQGGSTITQQVVKNALVGDERTIDRKIKEAVLASRLEAVMTKDQILERYLNLVYLGNGAYGIQAGAETYFGKPVGQLQPDEAALLAGMISNPVGSDPITRSSVATQRRNLALDQMVRFGHLAADEAELMRLRPLPNRLFVSAPVRESYFVEGLKQALQDDPRLGATPTERLDTLFRGGLQIHSTFDPSMQAAAERAVAVGNIIPANRLGAVGALVAVEPSNGHIRAVVGGPGFENFKYDIATHRPGRQPGSSFKLFTLLAALEAGYGPGSTVDGSGPCQVVGFGSTPSKPVLIQNSEGPGGGTETLEAATAGSVNCAYERMAATIGLDKMVDMAKRLGLAREYDEYPSVVIGAQEATPLEMASAYGTLANDGVRHAPTYLVRVEDRTGKVLFEGGQPGERVLSPQVARTATALLQRVLAGGTATGRAPANREAAGKTGTTDNYSNAWFVGYTPQMAAAVWMGVPTGNVPMTNVGGRRVFGSTYAAPAWQQFMEAVLVGQPAVPFARPDPAAAIGSRPFVLPPGSFIAGAVDRQALVASRPRSSRGTDRSSRGRGEPGSRRGAADAAEPAPSSPPRPSNRGRPFFCSQVPPGVSFPGC